jgi:hypothetical protein
VLELGLGLPAWNKATPLGALDTRDPTAASAMRKRWQRAGAHE